jgi:hypothetical protein
MPLPLALRQPWQLAIVPAGEVLADGADFGADEVKVIEQPFRGRRDERSGMDVRGQRPVSAA